MGEPQEPVLTQITDPRRIAGLLPKLQAVLHSEIGCSPSFSKLKQVKLFQEEVGGIETRVIAEVHNVSGIKNGERFTIWDASGNISQKSEPARRSVYLEMHIESSVDKDPKEA